MTNQEIATAVADKLGTDCTILYGGVRRVTIPDPDSPRKRLALDAHIVMVSDGVSFSECRVDKVIADLHPNLVDLLAEQVMAHVEAVRQHTATTKRFA